MQGSDHLGSRVPLVLRVIPAERQVLARLLDRRLTRGADGILWELVDATADETAWPAGVALTRPGPDDCVTVSVIAVRDGESAAACADLLRALIAVFRGRAAQALLVVTAEESVISTLRALGFVPAATHGHDLYV